MTAYARSELDWNNLHFNVEMRTLNHRYCDIFLKLPQKLLSLEEDIKQLIGKFITRGRVECTLKISGNMVGLPVLSVNWEAARAYYSLLKDLKTGLGLNGDITLDMFLGVKDIFTTEEEKNNIEEFWPPLKQVIEEALNEIKTMRQQEGEKLKKDIENRIQYIATILNKIKGVQEVVLFAERSDITEEIVRLETHLQKFKEWLEKDEPVGRKLDFLLQEMHREANTMGVKANNTFVSQEVVEIKTELEKIRQQIQNIE